MRHGFRWSWLLLALFGCDLTSLVPEPKPDDGFDRKQLLADYADTIVVPTLTTFAEHARALATATRAWSNSVDNEDADVGARWTAAQEAWRTAITTWQRAEILDVGPAGAPGVRTGGQGLRDEIYSWPTINPCGVDQQIVRNAHEASDFPKGLLVNTFGLDALEYLLFQVGDDNACPPSAGINRDGLWSNLGADEVAVRRAAYAARTADVVEATAQRLATAFGTQGSGGFYDNLVGAGESGSLFADAQAALDEVFAGMFYVELRTKDRKLAIPAGLHVECAQSSCPSLVESRFANMSRTHVLTNIVAIRDVLTGVDDKTGFVDFLKDRGADDVGTRFLAALNAAHDAFAAETRDLSTLARDDVEALRGLHAALKGATDLLKTEFPAALGLRVPSEGAGDND